ncbi:hypothetical protein [Treponema sp. R80B11-R83G3]
MNINKAELILLEPTAIDVKEDSNGFFFMIGDYRANIPPHYKAKNFNEQEILSFFIDKLSDVGVGVIVCFLYDLLQKRKIKNLKINNYNVNTEDEIKKALKNNE